MRFSSLPFPPYHARLCHKLASLTATEYLPQCALCVAVSVSNLRRPRPSEWVIKSISHVQMSANPGLIPSRCLQIASPAGSPSRLARLPNILAAKTAKAAQLGSLFPNRALRADRRSPLMITPTLKVRRLSVSQQVGKLPLLPLLTRCRHCRRSETASKRARRTSTEPSHQRRNPAARALPVWFRPSPALVVVMERKNENCVEGRC